MGRIRELGCRTWAGRAVHRGPLRKEVQLSVAPGRESIARLDLVLRSFLKPHRLVALRLRGGFLAGFLPHYFLNQKRQGGCYIRGLGKRSTTSVAKPQYSTFQVVVFYVKIQRFSLWCVKCDADHARILTSLTNGACAAESQDALLSDPTFQSRKAMWTSFNRVSPFSETYSISPAISILAPSCAIFRRGKLPIVMRARIMPTAPGS